MSASDELCSLRWNAARQNVEIIDQTVLPHTLRWVVLDCLPAFCQAISSMQVRGAPLIGITAAFGLARALAEDASTRNLESATSALLATRPTAINLRWALEAVASIVSPLEPAQRAAAALEAALDLRDRDIASCARIGESGLALLRKLERGTCLNVMTHCNAGWLATIRWGTALAPIYKAHAAGLSVHVWVSETRPRNQGINLTAWELGRAGVPFTIIADNSAGQLMREGLVDCVIVGSDRTAANGDVCNKVGTYLKALAASANDVPFYVALPASTIDWACPDGAQVPIEERAEEEVLAISGVDPQGQQRQVSLAVEGARAHNPAFDITPAELVSALVTDRGVCGANPQSLQALRQKR